jgi:hypothetical protein
VVSHRAFEVNDDLRTALEEAGWSDAFHFDADAWFDELRAEGFAINNQARLVLENLGGLTVRSRSVGTAAFGSGEARFEPLWAATGESDRIRARERQFGTSLCPLGEWCGEYILLAGGDGAIYAETTFQFLRLGTDIISALRTIVLADRLPDEL